VYIKSVPYILQTIRNEGSVMSSIGAKNNGFSPNNMLPIFKFLIY